MKEKLNLDISNVPEPPLQFFDHNSYVEQGRASLSGEKNEEKKDLKIPFDYEQFLSSHVDYKGRNLKPEINKVCSIVRALIEKPKLLLLSEEALDFGAGIVYNFKQLEKRLRNTTIVSITHKNENLFAYNKLILMDGGTVIDKGEPKHLLSNSKSFLYTYLKETDKKALRQQLAILGINVHDQTKLETLSRVPESNGSGKEGGSKTKEVIPAYSVFRQREDISKSPETPKGIPKSPPKQRSSVKSKAEPELEPPQRKRTYSVPNRTLTDRQSSQLFRDMCEDDSTKHKAIEMSGRNFGLHGKTELVFGKML